MRFRCYVLAAVTLLPGLARNAAAADLERTLDEHWRGAYVVVRPPIASDCGGFYTDDDAHAGRVDSRGSHRFAAGELAKVDSVKVRFGGRVDVFLDLAEDVLEQRSDGPFTLFDARSCKVQLKIDGAARSGLPGAEAAL